MPRYQLSIEGMSCQHCVQAVKEAVQELTGEMAEQVQVGSALVALAEPALLPKLKARLADEGFELTRAEALG